MRGIVAPSRPLSVNTSAAAFKRRRSDSRLRDCFTTNGFFAIALLYPLLPQISKKHLTTCKCEFTFTSRNCKSEFTFYFMSELMATVVENSEETPKGLPASLAGFEDQASFSIIVNEESLGAAQFTWRPDGSFEGRSII